MSDNLAVGQTVGNYRLEAFLARGGFGSVYSARHIVFTDRPLVAVKLMHTYLATPQDRDRFLQEARVLEKLKHRSILAVLDAGIDHTTPYLVTEYAPGGSLTNRLQVRGQRPFPLQEALEMLAQIGDALYYAHQMGVVHCDLKPDNILFSTSGAPLLSDFGIAAITDISNTATVDVVGSPPYMAPEQFSGKASSKSDQYALACVAYELFTGHRPFDVPAGANNLTWLQKHLMEPPIPPTRYNSYLSPALEAALLKALAKDRADRFPDVAAFLTTLGASLPQHVLAPLPMVSADPHLSATIADMPPFAVTQPVVGAGDPTIANASFSLPGLQQEQLVLPPQPETLLPPPPPQAPMRYDRFFALLSYLFLWIGGLLILCYKPRQSRFLRFHAWQSTLGSLLTVPSLLLLYYINQHDNQPLTGLLLVLLGAYSLLCWVLSLTQAARGRMIKIFPIGYIASLLVRKKAIYNDVLLYTPTSSTRPLIIWQHRLLAAVSYLLLGLPGLLLLVFGTGRRFLHFHALQSLSFSVLMVTLLLLGREALFWIVAPVALVGWLIGIFTSLAGKYYKLPFVNRLVVWRMGKNKKLG